MSEWTYQGREVLPEDLENQYGFVYLITNLTNNRKYIGRKYLTKASSKKVKGKTKKMLKLLVRKSSKEKYSNSAKAEVK